MSYFRLACTMLTVSPTAPRVQALLPTAEGIEPVLLKLNWDFVGPTSGLDNNTGSSWHNSESGMWALMLTMSGPYSKECVSTHCLTRKEYNLTDNIMIKRNQSSRWLLNLQLLHSIDLQGKLGESDRGKIGERGRSQPRNSPHLSYGRMPSIRVLVWAE